MLTKNNNHKLILFIFIFIILTFSTYAFIFSSEKNFNKNLINNDCCSEGKAVILVASNGALGLGHIALLMKNEPKLYYFSWQSRKVVFVEVPNKALDDFDSFNKWIFEKQSIQEYIHEFDFAKYVCGNFSNSLIEAENLFLEYLSNQKNINNISSYDKNNNYNLFFNNCLQVSNFILSEGNLCNGDTIKSKNNQLSFFTNIAKNQYKLILNYDSFFI